MQPVKTMRGFTMVELIVVLVLIGVLAGLAVPRFLNLSTRSNQNATNTIAAALGAVSATNFSKRTASSAQGSALSNCTQIGPLLTGGLPSGYTITSTALSNGVNTNCTVTGPGSTTATFVGTGIT